MNTVTRSETDLVKIRRVVMTNYQMEAHDEYFVMKMAPDAISIISTSDFAIAASRAGGASRSDTLRKVTFLRLALPKIREVVLYSKLPESFRDAEMVKVDKIDEDGFAYLRKIR